MKVYCLILNHKIAVFFKEQVKPSEDLRVRYETENKDVAFKQYT